MAHTGDSLPGFARKQFTKAIRRIQRNDRVALDTPSEELHVYRKAVRRARYVAEFFTPVLGPWGRESERHLNRMATELGLIHDIDVGIRRTRREFPESPAVLHSTLLARRRKAVEHFEGLRRKCRKRKWYQLRDR